MEITYSEAITQAKAMREKAASLAKAHISKEFKAAFEKFPKLEAVKWTQYTPYFNDGDTCEFGVNDHECKFVGSDGFAWVPTYEGATGAPDEISAARAIAEIFKGMYDEDLKAVFGDHVKVIANRDGFDVEGYEHD